MPSAENINAYINIFKLIMALTIVGIIIIIGIYLYKSGPSIIKNVKKWIKGLVPQIPSPMGGKLPLGGLSAGVPKLGLGGFGF